MREPAAITSSERWRLTIGQTRRDRYVGYVEAASLATRASILPRAEIMAELGRLAVLVTKTGGPAEEKAFRLLHEHILNTPETTDLDLAAARS